MTLGVYIVHHPERDPILPDLLEALGEPATVVVDDVPERMNPWKNWANAMRVAAVSGDTHALFLENDVKPCIDFVAAVRKCVAVRPDDLIRFYHPAEPYGAPTWRQVLADGGHWFPIEGHWGCVQAVAMPVEWITDFLHYGESVAKATSIFPDARLSMWMRTRICQPVWTTVPSLARHGWPSMCGQPHHDCPDELWIGDDVSALSIDWTP